MWFNTRACSHAGACLVWYVGALHIGCFSLISSKHCQGWFFPDNTCTACHGNKISLNCSCSQDAWY